MMINAGQGSQFTSEESVKTTRSMEGVQISLDAKGRGIDNVGVEFFFKAIKHVDPIDNSRALYKSVGKLVNYYNHSRKHSSLDYKKSANLYFIPPERTPSEEIEEPCNYHRKNIAC